MSQQHHNYYEVLGVSPSASTEQLRAAYREKVRIIHPDSAVAASPSASLQMAEVVHAWSTLSNPDLRRAYDEDFLESIEFPPAPIVRGQFPKSLIGWILTVGILGVLVLDALSSPIAPIKPDGLLQSGSCVVIDANKLAVEVGCEVEHYGVVRQLVGFDMTCPSDTESVRDRQGMGQACVVPSH
ncbi:unannotated protein [freshwater metagenome]|uniref:Unannotated protein n=1 Tax=freshwater metagenome TaxID=449393 RepID=A0A6J7G9Y3_9ZZZZ|nr:DnaJ domain-containing protein [Actinomycetota bacterium]MSW48986.1 DnaJ domain-containing protein [Actinomycetota bacterium]